MTPYAGSGRLVADQVAIPWLVTLQPMGSPTATVPVIEAVILSKDMGLTKEQVQTAKAIIACEVPRVSVLPASELGVG